MTFKRLRSALARLASILLSMVLVGALLVFGLIALGPHIFGYQTATMLTGSMEPKIAPGDVVLSVPRPAADVKVGDVISYHIPVDDHRVETHRVIEVITNKDGTTAVRTQGDANDGADPWVATLEGDTVPWIGTGIRALRSPFIQQNIFWGALALMLMVGMSMIWSRDEEELEPEHIAPVIGSLSPAGRAPHAAYVAALATLSEDLDVDYAMFYAGQWSDLLPKRVDRVRHAVDAHDSADALDAILSLKVSSVSVGATALADTAGVLEAAVREGSWDIATDLNAGLAEIADRSREELSVCLVA